MKKIALVVPTIRENCIKDFIKRWDKINLFDVVHLIVMEDNPTRTFELDPYLAHIGIGSHEYTHLCWEDIEVEFDKNSWIIPRRSDTVRSFAYWWAATRHTLLRGSNGFETKSYDYDYIATLDDDCYPPALERDGIEYESAQRFFDTHIGYLNGRTKWFNTLNSVKPRGVPFRNRGSRKDIVLNHGLWTNVLDYDAPTQLVDPRKEDYSFDNRIVPHGSYFPMCGMNVCWKRYYTPWMYHLLMGQIVEKDVVGAPGDFIHHVPFDRFGDIWCGVFFKKLADLNDLSVSTGLPYVRHERASDPWKNLAKEGPGLPVNEKLWEYVDKFQVTWDRWDCTPALMYQDFAAYVGEYDEFPEHAEYFKRLGEAMQIWAGLFV